MERGKTVANWRLSCLAGQRGGSRKMASDSHEPPRWRFLSSAQIEVPISSNRLVVRDRQNKRIGSFDGVIIDPAADRVRYLVVDAGWFRHERYLLPMDPT